MTICDRCKKEIITEAKRVNLPYEYACKAWQYKTFDLCGDCVDKLKDVVTIAQSDFINRRTEDVYIYNII